MNITVNSRHVEITDAIRAYAREKTLKLGRYFDKILTAEIIIDHDSGHNVVEVILKASHSTFVGKYSGDDMYGCIDQAIHKVEEQIRRHKDKLRDHKATGLGEQAANAADQEPNA